MKKKLIAIMLLIFLMLTLISCSDKNSEKQSENDNEGTLILNTNSEILCVGSKVKLYASTLPKDENTKLIWKSNDESIAVVDEYGMVTAVGSGETEITVSTQDNSLFKTCNLSVGDILVSLSYDSDTEGYGINKFASVCEAVENAQKGDSVIIYEGRFDENIVVSKSLSLTGINNPSLKGLKVTGEGTFLKIKNINFFLDSYPDSNTGVLEIDRNSDIAMSFCNFSVNTADEYTGGYAILAKGERKNLSISYCEFENFRYAVLLQNSGGTINIDGCNFTKNQYGIGVNLKSADGKKTNDASGIIANNKFDEVITKCEFVFTGSNYEGELIFSDIYG